MILRRLQATGLTYFKPLDIDFDAIEGGVIAVAGSNAQGKSALLEAMCPGILYQECPTRDKGSQGVERAFFSGEGSLKVAFTVGSNDYEAEILVKRSGVSYARLEGGGIKTDGKQGSYHEGIRSVLGPKESCYASAFAMQGGGGSVGRMEQAGPRKKLFNRYLGLDRIDGCLKIVREKLKGLAKAEADVAKITGDMPAIIEAVQGEEHRIRSLDAGLALLNSQKQANDSALIDARKRLEETADARRKIAERERLLERKSAIATEGERICTLYEELAATLEKPASSAPNVEALRKKLDAAKDAVAKLEKVNEGLRETRRVANQATVDDRLVGRVPCHGEGDYAGCELLAEAISRAKQLPALLDKVATLENELTALRQSTPSVDPIRDEVAKALEAKRVADNAAIARARDEERLRAAEGRLDALGKELVAVEAQIAGLGDVEETEPIDVEALEEDAKALAKERETTVKALASARTTADHLRKGKLELDGRLEETRALLEDLEPLRFLEQALSPDGIPAMEIAAIGPDITALASELLDGRFDSRLSLRIATDKTLGDGSLGADLAIRVMDSRRSDTEDYPLGNYCGGEKVVLEEALRTALCVYANERLERPWRTIFRDEAGSALDEENAAHYTSLLRQAREMGHFHHVFVISHDRTVIESCDSVLWIANGAVRLERRG